jgi:small-conductance mechanosensitive channel
MYRKNLLDWRQAPPRQLAAGAISVHDPEPRMVVRIRLRRAGRGESLPSSGRRLALALSALLTPAAAMALALALWRLGADLQLTARFVITQGIFSHWQAWLLLALALQLAASRLARYARSEAGRPRTPSRQDQAMP